MFIILLLIILIAAFNIISGMIMRGMEARGIYYANHGRIPVEFENIYFDRASVGIMGTAMGALLGIVFAVNIEFIRRF